MLPSARTRILERLADDDVVLDVGGWAVPFPRADWVLDLGPYDTRGEWGWDGPREQERYTRDTWIQRDVCAREPWPFADDQFNFVICSHTLEDLRDPIWVCSELSRVARAGYVETPTRLVEQAYGLRGPWAGWGHHHWLVDYDHARSHVSFAFKHHVVHAPGPDHFAPEFHPTLTDEDRSQGFWWEGSFTASERLFDTPEELHAYLRDFVAAHGPPGRVPRGGLRGRLRSLLGV